MAYGLQFPLVAKVNEKTIELFLDGELWKEVNKRLFFKYLKEFRSNLNELKFYEIEHKVAKEAALGLLARRSYLSAELSRKLREKGFSEDAVRSAVDFCQEKGYLDDLDRCLRFIENEERKGKGSKAILFALTRKGVSVSHKMVEQIRSREKQTLKKWWQKQSRKVEGFSGEKRIAFLLRRGFSMEAILSMVER